MQKHPNILLIMDDQHRWDYLGCYGADFVDTPNIDRIATSGVRFSKAFTSAPVCAPARIALATGIHPLRSGATDNDSYLPDEYPTYYQRLRDGGYRVGAIGKLDLAKPDKYNGRYGDRPIAYRWGFTHPEECEGKLHAALGYPKEPLRGPYTNYLNEKGLLDVFCEDYWERIKKWSHIHGSTDSPLKTEDFEDGYIGRRAAEWISNIPDDFPWHLFVSFVGPHDPFDPPMEYADLFRDAVMTEGIPAHADQKPQWIQDKQVDFTQEQLASVRCQYAALIKLIDDQVGIILNALEERGMLENTYIIFASDHGEMMGDHHLFLKSLPYEPSIHVPLICSGPGIPQGVVADTLVELFDLNPTICALAGVEPAPNMDARSLDPLLLDGSENHREYIVTAMPNWRCIRTEQYKYVDHYNVAPELYDLIADPQETQNIAGQHPDIVSNLRKLLNSHLLRPGSKSVFADVMG